MPDCQVEYYDETRCPPLARAAKLRGEPTPIGIRVNNV
jgi:hypothetical protein